VKKKAEKLVHVQRAAIRRLLFSYVDEKDLLHRYTMVTTKGSKDIRESLTYLDKDSLIKIVQKSPEISQELIDEYVEEYRYSSRPSFQLYLLQSLEQKLTSKKFITRFGKNKGVEILNTTLNKSDTSHKKWKELKFVDQIQIDPSTIELAFSYQQRYDYINPETEDTAFIFELKYGFVWINVDEKFISISAPLDSLIPVLTSKVKEAFGLYAISVNISNQIVGKLFNKESMKRTAFFHPNPPEGKPQKILIADSNMGGKTKHLAEYDGYDSPGSVYEERIDDEFYSTIGINCKKGKIYLTRQLKASQLRSWGLGRIKQIMAYVNDVYNQGESEEFWHTIGIENEPNLKLFTSSTEERKVILEVVKLILRCKKKKVSSIKLLGYKVEELYKLLRKYSSVVFHPFCSSCGNYSEIFCKSCGRAEIATVNYKQGKPKVYCGYCYEPHTQNGLECIEGHKITVESWYDSVQFIPLSAFTELVTDLINTYFPQTGFSLENESFYLVNDELVYSNSVSGKVMYKPSELEQFKHILDREVLEERREVLAKILEIIKEKCSRHSNEACMQCQHEKSLLCIMKPFVTFTEHYLHPHHGQEFGDVSFLVNLGVQDAVYVGIAKSYEKNPVTESSGKGREMIQQFIGKCMDERVNALGLIIAGTVDQGVIAMCQSLARKYNKKVIMWFYEEMVKVVDYAIETLGLDINNVKAEIEADNSANKKRGKSRTTPKTKKEKAS
jgi:hypothetical protein